MWFSYMQSYRYKAKFSGDTSSGNFFDTTTWIIYGPVVAFVACFLIDGIINYENTEKFNALPYSNYPSMLIIMTSPLVLFAFKLFAQHFKVIGLLFFLSNLFVTVLSFSLGIYWWVTEQLFVMFIGLTIYYGVMSLLTFFEYKAFDSQTT
jgi:hypothetical protein